MKELPDNWMYLEAYAEHSKPSTHIHAGMKCPGCGVLFLKYRSMPDFGETYWHCPTCGDWKTGDLNKALGELEEPEYDKLGLPEEE